MAVVDIDRHILTELVILLRKQRESAAVFRHQWETITTVRDMTEFIVLGEKNADHHELPKLRDKMFRAMKVCNTQMLVMDDAMSRQMALLNHLVSEIRDPDTQKGTESGNHVDQGMAG